MELVPESRNVRYIILNLKNDRSNCIKITSYKQILRF